MRFPVLLPYRNLTSHLRIVGRMLAVAPLCLMMTAAVPANGQTSTPASSPGDWTQFRTDNMQRWNPYETVLSVNNAGNLQLKWSHSYSTPWANTFSDPVTANGILYVSSDDHLNAYNASTGASLWTSTTIGSRSTPAVANGVVYFLSDDSNVYALNATTGAKLWSYYTGAFFSPPYDIAVADGVVYAGGGAPEGICGGGLLYALDANSGSRLWNYGGRIQYSPAIANGVVYFNACGASTSSGSVIAVNARTGDALWSYDGGTFSSPVVPNGMVYFNGSDSTGAKKLFAVNASTGKTQWTYGIDFASTSPPAAANGVIYVASVLTSNSSTNAGGVVGSSLNALKATTGQKLWSNQITETEVLELPAVANGVVYINGFANSPATTSHMYALNASTGAQLWSYPLPNAFANNPIVTNG
jgi:outer membrane protein assembly factor BamB